MEILKFQLKYARENHKISLPHPSAFAKDSSSRIHWDDNLVHTNLIVSGSCKSGGREVPAKLQVQISSMVRSLYNLSGPDNGFYLPLL